MIFNNVSMNVRKMSDRASIIDILGEVTAFAEEALTRAYEEACSHGSRDIILNFKDMEYMNSSGIGLLVMLLVRANRQKQRLAVVGLAEQYRHILELINIADAIQIFPTESEALTAYSV